MIVHLSLFNWWPLSHWFHHHHFRKPFVQLGFYLCQVATLAAHTDTAWQSFEPTTALSQCQPGVLFTMCQQRLPARCLHHFLVRTGAVSLSASSAAAASLTLGSGEEHLRLKPQRREQRPVRNIEEVTLPERKMRCEMCLSYLFLCAIGDNSVARGRTCVSAPLVGGFVFHLAF